MKTLAVTPKYRFRIPQKFRRPRSIEPGARSRAQVAIDDIEIPSAAPGPPILRVPQAMRYALHGANLLLAFFAPLALVACTSMVSHEKAVETLAAAKPCCESMARFRYEPLHPGTPVSFTLDESAEAFDFDSGRSYFKAFRLPDQAVPYRLKLSSFLLGEGMEKAHVFYPEVALLDERHVLLAQHPPGRFALVKADMQETASATMGLRFKLEGHVEVTEPQARYAVVHTDRRRLGEVIHYTYEKREVIPVILPGFVTALPGRQHQAEARIRLSPFGALLLEAVPAATAASTAGETCTREADIQPQNARIARYTGRQALLFVDAVEQDVDPGLFDTVVLLRGAEVFGGTVALILKEGCAVGRKFLSTLELIHAQQMLAFAADEMALSAAERLEFDTLRRLAEGGSSVAQFHVGLALAWGRGVASDRGTSIAWLRRAAEQDFGPAQLALGMALSGPGAVLDEAVKVGAPPRSDAHTDRLAAYVWLEQATHAVEPHVAEEARLRLEELAAIMTPEELNRARSLTQERKR